MTNTYEIITKLKEIRQSKNLSYQDIVDMTNGAVSKTTVSRVFADGSEETSFRYEETLRPIANALLDIDTIEETDNMEIQAMKSLLKYKMERIEDLEKQLQELKLNYLEKIEEQRQHFSERLDFANHQIDLKDKRMDQLLEAVFQKDKQQQELLDGLMTCPCRKGDIQ